MIRVIIGEHQHLLRMGLVAHLSQHTDIDVVAELDHSDQLIATASILRPAVAIIDVDLPPGGAVPVAALIRDSVPGCAIVLVVDCATGDGLRRAMAVGPPGILGRDAAPELFTRTVRRVAAGKRVLDPALCGQALLITESPLTARELDVLRIAAGGAHTNEIAERLCLSTRTVRNHLSRVITKIGARTRMDAIRIATEEGWLT